MKLSAIITLLLVLAGLSGCATVDISRVTTEQGMAQETGPKLNVVERASAKMTALFRKNGWCSNTPREDAQTATDILLHGMKADTSAKTQTENMPVGTPSGLSENLQLASREVAQMTKVAEVFLTIADDTAILDRELSLLEMVLLSAREAQSRFEQEVKDHRKLENEFEAYRNSVRSLKTVTDFYGERTRAQIMGVAQKMRS